MLKHILTILSVALLSTLSTVLFSQQQEDFNLEFVGLGSIEFPDDIGSSLSSYNDVWGWVSNDGTEYGIIGSGVGTSIFSLENPAEPKLVSTVAGSLSVWRDIKSYGNYLYVVADQGNDGLLIIDMTHAPDSISHTFWKPELEVHGNSTILSTCHNLYIDSTFVFLAGCDGTAASRGVLIFDLSVNPMAPEYISATDPVYAHDVFVNNERLYASNLGNGFSVVDISNPADPVTLAFQETSGDFTHNAWSSDDNKYLYTTDERSNAFVDAYDVSDPDDIQLLDQYRPYASLGLGTIPHNVHHHNQFLVISYYTDGVKIVDAHDPTNMVEVASYDTYYDRDGTFGGAWGAYPYLPSGLVLASDRTRGLFVLQPDYVRAGYIRGTVVDSLTGEPVENAQITFLSDMPGYDVTNADGHFSTGLAADGVHEVTVYKDGYRQKNIEVELISGETDTLEIHLSPLNSYQVTGQVIDDESGEPISGAQVVVFNEDYAEFAETDASGAFQINSYEGSFNIAAGKWGYLHQFVDAAVSSDVSGQVLRLKKGYRDDFIFDYGWSVASSARVGSSQEWQLGNPGYAVYDGVLAGPNGDIEGDLGSTCYVTGIAASLSANLTDTSVLTSPLFDLSDFEDPYINYYLWFNDQGVNPPDDELHVYLGNSEEETLIERITEPFSGWHERSEIRVLDYMDPGTDMFVKLVAADTGNVHIYKAAIDAFSITEGLTTNVNNQDHTDQVKVYPNPCINEVWIQSSGPKVDRYVIVDVSGQLMSSGSMTGLRNQIDMGFLDGGIYFLQTFDGQTLKSVSKVIKLP